MAISSAYVQYLRPVYSLFLLGTHVLLEKKLTEQCFLTEQILCQFLFHAGIPHIAIPVRGAFSLPLHHGQLVQW